MTTLPPRQAEALKLARQFCEQHNRPPTMGELSKLFDPPISQQAAQNLFVRIQNHGYFRGNGPTAAEAEVARLKGLLRVAKDELSRAQMTWGDRLTIIPLLERIAEALA